MTNQSQVLAICSDKAVLRIVKTTNIDCDNRVPQFYTAKAMLIQNFDMNKVRGQSTLSIK